MALDFNPMAAGYGTNPMMGQPQGSNPQQGVASPQKAASMPGAIAQMVDAIKGGYQKGVANRAGGLPGPTLAGAGAPLAGTPDAIGLHSPDVPMGPPIASPGPEGLPGPVATMPPPMPGGGAVPFTGGTPGLPGIGDYVGPPGGGQSIMDIIGGGGGGMSPQDLSIASLLGGPGPVGGGWGMFG